MRSVILRCELQKSPIVNFPRLNIQEKLSVNQKNWMRALKKLMNVHQELMKDSFVFFKELVHDGWHDFIHSKSLELSCQYLLSLLFPSV